MNIEQQAEHYLAYLESRRRNPIKPNTIKSYRSQLRTWIVPLIGAEDLATFENGAMRKFVGKLAAADLSVASINGVINLVKGIIRSATDENGNEMYPRTWNNNFIDLPIIDPRSQKAPIISREALQEAISGAQEKFKPLYSFLAGTGLRIAEALAVQGGPDDGRGSFWSRDRRTIVVRGQIQDGEFRAPKTTAGYREVDVCPELCSALAGLNDQGYLFEHRGKPIPVSTAREALNRDGIPGFHSLRRFRATRLREVGVPEDILKFWLGHSATQDITDRYSKLAQNVALRREWADRAGLGFRLNAVD